jgi:hypothetical protein
MANDKARTELAEKVAKHADLSVNAVLRVFYALSDLGVDVTTVTKTPSASATGSQGQPADKKAAKASSSAGKG